MREDGCPRETRDPLEALAGETPRVVLATGRLVGEGFDHPALDTRVLAMQVAWKGTLQQYAGRLQIGARLKAWQLIRFPYRRKAELRLSTSMRSSNRMRSRR
jgi:hypothetical protein